MKIATLRDPAILLARLAIGFIFIAHGWQKLAAWGLDGTAASFEQMGVPMPAVSAAVAAFIELVAGAALVVGLVVPVAGLLLTLDMLGAFVLVHASNGVFVSDNGFALVLALGAGGLVLAAVGGGRYSVDELMGTRITRHPDRDSVRRAG